MISFTNLVLRVIVPKMYSLGDNMVHRFIEHIITMAGKTLTTIEPDKLYSTINYL